MIKGQMVASTFHLFEPEVFTGRFADVNAMARLKQLNESDKAHAYYVRTVTIFAVAEHCETLFNSIRGREGSSRL